MRYFLIYLVMSFGFYGCVTGHLVNTPNGYSLTRGGGFKLKDKFQLADTKFIDSNRIYVLSGYGNSLLKFYSNGRVAWARFFDKPGHFKFAGYFKLEGNNITIEMSDGGTGKDWSRLVIRGQVLGDTLKFFKDQWGGYGRNAGHFTNLRDVDTGGERFYIKSNLDIILKPADW